MSRLGDSKCSLGKANSISVIRQSSFLRSRSLIGERNKLMKTKIIWGGAVLAVLLILGVSLYRQIRQALTTVSFAISRLSMDAYPAW